MEGRWARRRPALQLCRKVFQTRLPASLTATLDKSVTMRWLEATALKAMTGEYEPHEVRPVAASRPFFSAAVSAIIWHSLCHCRSQCGSSIRSCGYRMSVVGGMVNG